MDRKWIELAQGCVTRRSLGSDSTALNSANTTTLLRPQSSYPPSLRHSNVVFPPPSQTLSDLSVKALWEYFALP